MEKGIWRWACALLAIACLGEGALLAKDAWRAPKENAALYEAAVRDAAFADAEEIAPLVELTRESDMVTWDAAGERALFLTWHADPAAYIGGATIERLPGEVWVFTDGEMRAWYEKNKAGVSDWTLRLEQLIGLPEECGYTHVSALWARPEDVARPACVTDPRAQMRMEFDATGTEEFLTWYRAWFDANTLYSYFESAYPWTRLGYTYDWADNGREYGLSEFLLLPGTQAEVEFTLSTQDFVRWLETGER